MIPERAVSRSFLYYAYTFPKCDLTDRDGNTHAMHRIECCSRITRRIIARSCTDGIAREIQRNVCSSNVCYLTNGNWKTFTFELTMGTIRSRVARSRMANAFRKCAVACKATLSNVTRVYSCMRWAKKAAKTSRNSESRRIRVRPLALKVARVLAFHLPPPPSMDPRMYRVHRFLARSRRGAARRGAAIGLREWKHALSVCSRGASKGQPVGQSDRCLLMEIKSLGTERGPRCLIAPCHAAPRCTAPCGVIHD